VRPLLALGALECAIAVALGAFGAHALADRLDARALELWHTSARYLIYSGLGALIAATLAPRLAPPGAAGLAAALLVAGGALFSGTLAALALGAPRWLGAVTPLGGLSMILGFLVLAWSLWRGAGGLT
jgi:uncharacterized membrane protein YgdD (TMEM256/DUF423 family)